MGLIIADRVKESTTTTGTGTLTLAGAVANFRAFSAVMAVGDTCYYVIEDSTNGAWEVGLGTYSGTNTLTRTTVLASSNSGSAVDLAAGTKNVWIDLSASQVKATYEAGILAKPVSSDYTWANQGTSTVTDGTKALVLTPQANAFAHGMYRAVPSAPFDIYCRLNILTNNTLSDTSAIDIGAGIMLRDSADSEVVGFYAGVRRVSGDEQNYFFVRAIRWTSDGGAFSADIFGTGWRPTAEFPQWLRVNVTSTTITFYVSPNGADWLEISTETISTFLDTVTHYGFSAYGNSSSGLSAFFSYFSTTTPHT